MSITRRMSEAPGHIFVHGAQKLQEPFIHTYAKLPIGSLLLDSCFTEAGFVLVLRPEPEPSS
ncbi:MAG: hypothetical protein ACYDHM_04680, partial [Acidiferrobacterales bacterium]